MLKCNTESAFAFASVMSVDAAAVRLATLVVRLFDSAAFSPNSFVPSAIEAISRRRNAGMLLSPTANGRSLAIAATISERSRGSKSLVN